jgi:hypothetical protein
MGDTIFEFLDVIERPVAAAAAAAAAAAVVVVDIFKLIFLPTAVALRGYD